MKKLTEKSIIIVSLIFTAMSFFAVHSTCLAEQKEIIVGSKEFTEQRILGHIMIAMLENNGFNCINRTGLGGTLVARKALENKQIDIYMEYTGTGLITILKHKKVISDSKKCYAVVKKEDFKKNKIVWLPYMSFNNTYCLMMQRLNSERLEIKTIADLAQHINTHPKSIFFGMGAEFYARPDGYQGLKKAYSFNLSYNKILKMSDALVYKALKNNQIHVGVGFATDGRIKGFDFVLLKDNKKFFPVYNPAPIVRIETLQKYPELKQIFKKLGTKLSSKVMRRLNYEVDIEHKNLKEVVKNWLINDGLLDC